MLDAREKSFAEKLFGGEDTLDLNKGPALERAFGAQAANLRVWDKSGRLAAGLSWSSYVTDEWDNSESIERLTLVFASRYLVLWGHHLLAYVRQLDEGRLKNITERDGPKTMQMLAENASIRDEAKKTPIVTRFEIGPGIQDLVSALKGDEK